MASENDLLRVLLGVVALLVLLPVLLMLFMMPMMGMWGGGHMADGGMGMGTNGATWMWVVMWLLPLAAVVAIGYLVYRGVSRSADGGTDPAIEELRAAYARGDLTDEEFEERRDRLRRE